MPFRISSVVAISAVAGVLGACATPNYQAVHKASPASPPVPPNIGDIPFDPSHDAVTIIEELEPPGFSYDRARNELVAAPGSGHEVVTWVQLTFPLLENPGRVFWFIRYRPEQRWRKGYCYWQVPLLWVTLGAWHIVPLHYVCPVAPWHVGALREIAGKDQRREILRDGLQAEAVRAGGNAVVGAKIFDQGATGWIVRMGEGAPAAPPTETTSDGAGASEEPRPASEPPEPSWPTEETEETTEAEAPPPSPAPGT